MNGYIPDCTHIGTSFVSSIANMLSTAALDVKLSLGPQINQFVKDRIIGSFKYLEESQ